jgi:hypothetical protein
LSNDKEYVNIPLAIAFARYFGPQVLGVTSRKSRKQESQEETQNAETEQTGTASTKEETTPQVVCVYPENCVSNTLRQMLRELFFNYYNDVATHLGREHRVSKHSGYST